MWPKIPRGKEKKLSKMRAHCKSKSDVRLSECGVPLQGKQAVAHTGPKPTK